MCTSMKSMELRRTRENEVQMIPGKIKWMCHKWDFTVRIRSVSVWSVLAVCLMWSVLGQFRLQMQWITAAHFELTISLIGSKSTSINFTGIVVRIFFLVSTVYGCFFSYRHFQVPGPFSFCHVMVMSKCLTMTFISFHFYFSNAFYVGVNSG